MKSGNPWTILKAGVGVVLLPVLISARCDENDKWSTEELLHCSAKNIPESAVFLIFPILIFLLCCRILYLCCSTKKESDALLREPSFIAISPTTHSDLPPNYQPPPNYSECTSK